MTPEQKRLARHALGLPNKHNRSYRNRYFTGPGHPEWELMVKNQWAVSEKFGNMHHYEITRKGAELALEQGESLCLEDFQEE